ncbi:MAG: hypothetical protein ACPIOQ_13485, partial [Promethearchaeia archaeon]
MEATEQGAARRRGEEEMGERERNQRRLKQPFPSTLLPQPTELSPRLQSAPPQPQHSRRADH